MKKLRVWWIPQVPGKPFHVEVETVASGVLLLNTLADYDQFQLDNNIKPDYCNVGGLQEWEPNADGPGQGDWVDWYDEQTGTDDPFEFIKNSKS